MDVQLGHTEEHKQGQEPGWGKVLGGPGLGEDLLSILCMDSKRLQDLGASNVMLDKVYGILVVFYAWKFTPREGLASIPKCNHDGDLPENIDDSCSESTMTGGNASECTDELAYMYEWEDMAARDLGLRTCAALPMVDCPKGDYPKMPCVPAEEHHREKAQWYHDPLGGSRCSKAMDSMKKEWKGLIDQGIFDLAVIREYHDDRRTKKCAWPGRMVL